MREKFKQFLILAVICSPFTTWAEDYLTPLTRNPLRSIFHIDLETQAYLTNSNFLANENNQVFLNYIENQDSLILNTHKITFFYTPIKWVRIIPHMKSKFFYNARSRYSVFSPTEIGGTLRFPILLSRIGFLPAFEFVFPLDRQQEVRRAILSDEAIAFNVNLYTQLRISKNWIPFGKIGFQHRGRNLLNLFQAQAGLKYRDYVWELGALMGTKNPIASLNPPAPKSYLLNEFNSGSLKHFVLNPFAIGTTVWAEARLNKRFHLYSVFLTDLFGVNHSQGFGLSIGFKYKFIEKAKRKRSRNFRQRSQDIESILNSSDQELFKEIEQIR